jgi:hypothetical protein
MSDSTKEYALIGASPWIDFPDPGCHHLADDTLDSIKQRDVDTVFKAVSSVYYSQQNVKEAVNGALNVAVQKVNRQNPSVMGVRELCPTDDPRADGTQLRS